jgi:transposase
MGKKISYRTLDVEQVSLEQVEKALTPGVRVVVGVDVAKRNFVAALCDDAGETRLRVRFEAPAQTRAFVSFLAELQGTGRVAEVAMEPTGTYGDALRYRLGAAGIAVFRVSNKHVHDASELFDSSPSKHDGKDASVIGWLHAHARSKRWEELDAARRSMRALIAQRDLHDDPLQKLLSHVEPLLSRHFPEFEKHFELSQSKTPWVLLSALGSAQAIAKSSVQGLNEVIRKELRKLPSGEKLQTLIDAAQVTTGTAMVAEEVSLVRRMSREILHQMRSRDEVDALIEETGARIEVVKAMRPCIGPVTAAVLYAYLGDPTSYHSAAAFEKAAGLNLIESSSGTDPNAPDNVPRHISKRGAGIVRKYLFLAAMRLVRADPTVKAWYQRRRSFTAEQRTKAVVAVQRKLCRALVHIAKGEQFDADKLFDRRRLGLPPTSNGEAA